MPEFFNTWLRTLTSQQAAEMWLWFDGCAETASEVIDIVAPLAGVWADKAQPHEEVVEVVEVVEADCSHVEMQLATATEDELLPRVGECLRFESFCDPQRILDFINAMVSMNASNRTDLRVTAILTVAEWGYIRDCLRPAIEQRTLVQKIKGKGQAGNPRKDASENVAHDQG